MSPSSTVIISISTAWPLCGCVIAGYTRYGRVAEPESPAHALSIAAAIDRRRIGHAVRNDDDAIGGDTKGIDHRADARTPMGRRSTAARRTERGTIQRR